MSVTFGADDCLASKRRDYRRQRRHSRSTRQRIAHMEKLLAHLKVLTPEQLKGKHQQAGGNPVPWLLVARLLASNGDAKYLLDWPELWDVLRWYAHNRGYDGNRRWSAQEAEAQADDTEKEKNANALMDKFARRRWPKLCAGHSASNRSAINNPPKKISNDLMLLSPAPSWKRKCAAYWNFIEKNCLPSMMLFSKPFSKIGRLRSS
ncbi:MAG: hypothetical protein WDM76_11065 [Limisphaerales bacterium]